MTTINDFKIKHESEKHVDDIPLEDLKIEQREEKKNIKAKMNLQVRISIKIKSPSRNKLPHLWGLLL